MKYLKIIVTWGLVFLAGGLLYQWNELLNFSSIILLLSVPLLLLTTY